MSEKYRIQNSENAHFLTMTTTGWIDVFTRPNLKNVIVESLDFCIQNKGLQLYAWCLMSNHLHLVCKATKEQSLSCILRDFKTYTSKTIIKTIKHEPESRRKWMLKCFEMACLHLKREQTYKVWQNGNHPIEISCNLFLHQKINYIHNNPVKNGIVKYPEEYLYSSAKNYTEEHGLLKVCVINGVAEMCG